MRFEKEKFSERTIVLCETDGSARRATIALNTKNFHTCIFTADMFSECYAVAEMERKKFISGHGRVAVCSVDVFKLADLPHIEHVSILVQITKQNYFSVHFLRGTY